MLKQGATSKSPVSLYIQTLQAEALLLLVDFMDAGSDSFHINDVLLFMFRGIPWKAS